MNKRGRLNVFEKYYGRDSHLKKYVSDLFPDWKDRAVSNYLYQSHANNLISEAASNIPLEDILVKNKYRAGILEQLGRMNLQDGYSENDTIHVAEIAVELLEDGYKCREIEKYIRRVRLTGQL